MHVALVMMTGNPSFSGGVPAVVMERARYLVAQGHRASVVCRAARGFDRAEEREGIHIFPVGAAGRLIEAGFARLQSVSPYFLRRLRGGLAAAHAAAPLDLVDLQDGPAILGAGPFCRAHGVPLVFTLHGSAKVNPGKRPWIGRRLHVAYERMAYRQAQRVLAVSAFIARTPALFGAAETPLAVIPSPIDPRFFDLKRAADPQAHELRVLFLSRVFPEKRLDLLIRALAQLPRRRFRLVVVGDGPARPAVAALAARLGVAAEVEWHGFVTDRARVGALIEGAHVFCFPTEYEAQGLALVETLAAGLYPVVSNIPVLLETVEADYTFAAGDAAALATRLREVGDDRGRLAAHEPSLRALARPYRRDTIYPRLLEEYRAAIEAEPGP